MSTMTTTTLNQLDTTIFKVIENEILTLIDKVVNECSKNKNQIKKFQKRPQTHRQTHLLQFIYRLYDLSSQKMFRSCEKGNN